MYVAGRTLPVVVVQPCDFGGVNKGHSVCILGRILNDIIASKVAVCVQ